MISTQPSYRVELDTNSTSKASLCSFPTLEASGFHIFERKDLPETFLQGVFDITGQDNDFLYYRDDILEKSSTCECIEMLCGDSPSGPVSISLKKDKQEYNCLIRTIKVCYHINLRSVLPNNTYLEDLSKVLSAESPRTL